MSELLPITITDDTHPLAIRLAKCYRPHTPIPSRQELLEGQYYQQQESIMGIKSLTEQCGMEYNKEVNRRQ